MWSSETRTMPYQTAEKFDYTCLRLDSQQHYKATDGRRDGQTDRNNETLPLSACYAVAQFCSKIWGQRRSGQLVKPSNCFRLHPTSMISKHSTISVPDNL